MEYNLIFLFSVFVGLIIFAIILGCILAYREQRSAKKIEEDYLRNKKKIDENDEDISKFPFQNVKLGMSKDEVDKIIDVKGFQVEETQEGEKIKQVFVYTIDTYDYDDLDDEDFFDNFSIYGIEVVFENNQVISKQVIYEID